MPNNLRIGKCASLTKQFTEVEVYAFSELVGDRNPIHLDEAYAAQTDFGKRIVHGILTAGLISAIFGEELPGPGSIYLGQTLQFLAPVYIGDTVTAKVEVTGMRSDKPIVTFRTTCENQQGVVVLEGEATLMVPSIQDNNQ